ncbi:hypothetical protein ABVT39_002797 [Epinephelus coioides]
MVGTLARITLRAAALGINLSSRYQMHLKSSRASPQTSDRNNSQHRSTTIISWEPCDRRDGTKAENADLQRGPNHTQLSSEQEVGLSQHQLSATLQRIETCVPNMHINRKERRQSTIPVWMRRVPKVCDDISHTVNHTKQRLHRATLQPSASKPGTVPYSRREGNDLWLQMHLQD